MSGPLKISQYPPATSAQDTDEMVANQNGTTRKITVGQVRAPLAPAVHTHTEADLIGTIAPARLAQAGASTGQVLKWNGTAWAPATDTVGGGGSTDWSALTGIPAAIDAIDALTPAADRIAYYTGASAAALAPLTGFARSLLDDADAAAARSTLGAAAAAHGHVIADITNLQTALDGKAATTHTHAAADVTDFAAAARAETEAMVVAGTNLAIAYGGAGATRTATIAAVGGAASYAALTANRQATAADNGRVVECDESNRTLTLPPGLGKGFACVVRRTAAGNATVAKGGGVTFAPVDADVSTAALWDEIAVECIADTGSAATFLVRLVPA
ncbi:hypothetical protein [Elioraea sp.]|uniref:hypothetical protein n=1 Tax=Elioraea sp. TaxID=2185103 RepID=UPI00307D46BD